MPKSVQEIRESGTLEEKVDFLIDFVIHCRKVADTMSKHPMLAGMLPPDVRNMGNKG